MVQTIRLGVRLRAARKAAGFKTSKEFIRKHDVPASTYSQHESGKRSPDNEMLKFYCKVFGVNMDWLVDGAGQPFAKPTTLQKNVINEELLDISSQKKANKSDYADINQKLFTMILDGILELHRPTKFKNLSGSISKTAVSMYVETVKKYSNAKEQLHGAKIALNKYKAQIK